MRRKQSSRAPKQMITKRRNEIALSRLGGTVACEESQTEVDAYSTVVVVAQNIWRRGAPTTTSKSALWVHPQSPAVFSYRERLPMSYSHRETGPGPTSISRLLGPFYVALAGRWRYCCDVLSLIVGIRSGAFDGPHEMFKRGLRVVRRDTRWWSEFRPRAGARNAVAAISLPLFSAL